MRSLVVIALSLWIASPFGLGEPALKEPKIQTKETRAPWGVVLDRKEFYLKDDKKVLHGVEEFYSDDGAILYRTRNRHGKGNGVQEFFYEDGKKETTVEYVDDIEHGLSQTFARDGTVLFEGRWKDGSPWNGWFSFESDSSSGSRHDHKATWKIEQFKNGKKVDGSDREVSQEYRTWEPGQRPKPELFARWDRSQFAPRTDYPFLDVPPPFEKIPFMISWMAEEKGDSLTAYRQLSSLSRMDFGRPDFHRGKEKGEAIAHLRTWWEQVGKHLPALEEKRGVRDQAAWDLVQGDRNLPLPASPIVLPTTFKLEVSYGSGDYDGITSETITIARTKNGATLRRQFAHHRNARPTVQEWHPFSIEEAERVTRAMAYLIDHPWLLNDEQQIEKEFWTEKKQDQEADVFEDLNTSLIPGRESFKGPYYPNAHLELRDEKGQLWWNADPTHWWGGNPDRFNRANQAAESTVYPFLTMRYPESKMAKGEEAGWRAVKSEPAKQ